MLGFLGRRYLHQLIFVLQSTWSKRMFVRDSKMRNRFKRFFVIDSLLISNFLLVEQMNQINVQDNRNQKTS